MTDYEKALMASSTIRSLGKKLKTGTITSREMNRLVGEYGKIAGKQISTQLLSEFPNGQVPEDEVRRVISPILKQSHKFVSELTAAYLNLQYEKTGTGLKAVVQDYNISREDEMVKEISRRSFADELEG